MLQKNATLIMAQADHLSGEMLGAAVEKIMELGASNVQLLSTITKKNRPGTILLIDTGEKAEGTITDYLARELKISGFHRINTTHQFHPVNYETRNLTINHGGGSFSSSCKVKIIGDTSDPMSIDVEHGFLLSLQWELEKSLDVRKSVLELKSIIESRLLESGGDIEISLM